MSEPEVRKPEVRKIDQIPRIALVGCPNTGKTALFNALTGSRQRVANYAGVTVEKKEGLVRRTSGHRDGHADMHLLDLPGTRSLSGHSPDETVTRDVLLEGNVDGLIVVLDATNLERTLPLFLEVQKLGYPMVVALNMMDLARARGQKLNLASLEAELGVPVVSTVAVKNSGTSELLVKLKPADFSKRVRRDFDLRDDSSGVAENIARAAQTDRVMAKVTETPIARARLTEKLDRILMHPILGVLTLVGVLTVVFQAIFNWSEPPKEVLDGLIQSLSLKAGEWIGPGPLRDLVVDGAFAGVGAVVAFLPQILILFFFILVLEDSGYLARAAVLLDRLMRGAGLSGRSFIPLLSSYACAIPGIMAARTIESPRERLATILVAPLMTCSARLPVYTLLIAAFIPNVSVVGPLKLQGLVLLGLYVLGTVAGFVVAWVLARMLPSAVKGESLFLMEMPTYKWPSRRNLLIGLWQRASVFVKRAGTVIFSLSIVLWFMVSHPLPETGQETGQEIAKKINLEQSYAGRVGQAMQPLLAPLGFDWRISVALIPGFAAREVMVGALATVFAVEGDDQAARVGLTQKMPQAFGLATALSLLIWYVFAPQCLSTIAVARRETGSWKWAGVMTAYMFVLAYLGSLLTFQIVRLL